MNEPAPVRSFAALPELRSGVVLRAAWPTPNRALFDAPERFFARTRANTDYGKPGFTRDCGRQFHGGCDIAPVQVSATGQTTRVRFTDCATGAEFESEEPTFIPHDEVFCVYAGQVVELVDDEAASDFGKHLVVEHAWPGLAEKFYTLYGHLSSLAVTVNCQPSTGQLVARMGQTSRRADARNWMGIAPHLHFEVRNARGERYDPVEFLRRFVRA